MTELKEPIGAIPAAAVQTAFPRVPPDVVAGYESIGDLTGTVSDALDVLGISGTLSSSVLRPTIPGARVIGSAVTLRHDPVSHQAVVNTGSHVSQMAEVEAHNQAQPGDVLVIQGVPYVSGMGGISATIGKRQGEVGAIVDAGIRDLQYQRSIGYPIWSSSITPVTGKWRVVTTEVNGPVRIQGIMVNAGDLVIADDTGICFVPNGVACEVLGLCQAIVAKEVRAHERIASNTSMKELAEMLREINNS